jgi:hypothetical protein
MQIWTGFYSVVAGAAATLLGLLFVAVSINASVILDEAHGDSRRLAEQAFQNYLAAMLVSLLSIFPALDISELGFAVLALTAMRSAWALVRLYLAATRPHDPGSRLQSLRRHLISLVGFGMLTIAAVRTAFNLGDSRGLFAIATMILLFSATTVSWELLLRIAKKKLA